MNGKLCIATSSTDIISETFIRTHIERLDFEKVVLSGERLTNWNGGSLLAISRFKKLVRRFKSRTTKFSEDSFRSKRLASFFIEQNVKVVLGEYGVNACTLTNACRLAGVPLIAHFHGFDASNESVLNRLREAYHQMFASAYAVVGVSQAMCAQLDRLGALPDSIHYVPYFVDPENLPSCKAESNGPTFLSVGRLVDKKAPHLTLLAFSKVVGEIPEASLTIIGDGDLMGPCKDLAAALGISRSVSFQGAQSHHTALSAMQKSRCFVQHSVTASSGDSEGTPLAILEAQASGLPVVSTYHAGIPDVVVDGETGFLVRERDVNSMAERMIQVATDDPTVKRMSENARNRVCSLFNEANTLGKLSQIIRDAGTGCDPDSSEGLQ